MTVCVIDWTSECTLVSKPIIIIGRYSKMYLLLILNIVYSNTIYSILVMQLEALYLVVLHSTAYYSNLASVLPSKKPLSNNSLTHNFAPSTDAPISSSHYLVVLSFI